MDSEKLCLAGRSDTTGDAVLGIVASMAPDCGATVNITSSLVDDLGFDSVRLLELGKILERMFSCSLDGEDGIYRAHTVSDLIEVVEARRRRVRDLA
jgi:acyl carrier protein